MIKFTEGGQRYICNPFNEQIDLAIRTLAREKGLDVFSGSRDMTSYPYLAWDGKGVYGSCISLHDLEYKRISIDEFIEGIENSTIFKLSLTPEYDAVIKDDGIHVGCQWIKFETFDKLVELVNKKRKK